MTRANVRLAAALTCGVAVGLCGGAMVGSTWFARPVDRSTGVARLVGATPREKRPDRDGIGSFGGAATPRRVVPLGPGSAELSNVGNDAEVARLREDIENLQSLLDDRDHEIEELEVRLDEGDAAILGELLEAAIRRMIREEFYEEVSRPEDVYARKRLRNVLVDSLMEVAELLHATETEMAITGRFGDEIPAYRRKPDAALVRLRQAVPDASIRRLALELPRLLAEKKAAERKLHRSNDLLFTVTERRLIDGEWEYVPIASGLADDDPLVRATQAEEAERVLGYLLEIRAILGHPVFDEDFEYYRARLR